MGNAFSGAATRDNVTGESEIVNMSESDNCAESQDFHDALDEVDDRDERSKAKEAEMEEFRRQLQIKRDQRREILDRHKAEKRDLETCLDVERKAKLQAYENNRLLRELLLQNNIELPEDLRSFKENSDISETIVNMKEEFEKLRSQNNRLRRDVADANVALQGAYSDIAELQMQNTESIKQINALKEVVSVSKTMLELRENQLGELKEKLSEIERSLADRETSILSSDLRQEYERQLQNIRALRTLYEERARLAEVTRQGLLRELEEQKTLKQAEIEKGKELLTKLQELESRVNELQEMISNKNNQIYTCQDETRGLKAEMSAVNKLFSQVLLGYKNRQDLDKLVHRLEENHGILTHMAENENDSEASTALPKLLLEIVSQVDEREEPGNSNEDISEEPTANQKSDENAINTTAEEIVQNLPKVWRVLIELLSHQAAPDETVAEKVTTCYKTVETKTGPVEVPSVSQTYIRLKDLIVEKLGLVKEVNRMKQLNAHLETRLEEQERRLCLVTNELSKTWHVVGRLRRHHHQLHTHEKILKYELQQKRKLLNELKEELEYCREKWDQAREKNTQSEKDWKELRAEFSGRKAKSNASINNSAESGYSDERPSEESSESNDESEYATEPQIRSKKKLKKSFETILDSSTDRNLAAEREDPVSDMLDVADLPLDTHDDDQHHDVTDSFNSEIFLKSEKICETEDEVGDIANDSCTEDQSVAEQSQVSRLITTENKCQDLPSTSSVANVVIPTIDPAVILKSIKEQTERLANKDKKLEKLEKSGAALLQQTQNTVKFSDKINSTLDHLLNRPISSQLNEQDNVNPENIDIVVNKPSDSDKCVPTTSKSDDLDKILEDVREQSNRLEEKDKRLHNIEKDCVQMLSQLSETLNAEESVMNQNDFSTSSNSTDKNNASFKKQNTTVPIVDESTTNTSSDKAMPIVDFKAILENVKKQDERLVKKDERLQKLEQGCSEVLNNITKTLSSSEDLSVKLDILHDLNCSTTSKHSSSVEDCEKKIEQDGIENIEAVIKEENVEPLTENDVLDKPSTSNETDSTVDFKVILENVQKQKERLVQKYKRLDQLEASCSEVVQNITNSLSTGEELSERLDYLHIKNENKAEDFESESHDSRDSSEPSTSSEMDHEALFAARDLRLKRLEEQTKSLVSKVNKTTDKGVKIHYKLEELHNIYGSENSRASTPSDNEEKDKVPDETDKPDEESHEE